MRLRSQLAAANVPLVFAIYPSHLTVYHLWASDQIAWVRTMADSIGIPTIDFTAALRSDGRPKEALYLLPLDGHPSPAGYALTAYVLSNGIDSLPVLRARCAIQSSSVP